MPICSYEETINEFETLTRDAERVQKDKLKKFLELDVDAKQYLKHFGLNGRTDVESYKSRIPMCVHTDLEPYIQRIADGDSSTLLTVEPFTSLSLSSGTTQGKPKFLPFNGELLEATLQIFQITCAFRNRSEHCIKEVRAKTSPAWSIAFATAAVAPPDGWFVPELTPNSSKAEANHVRKNILVLSRGGNNGGCSPEGTSSRLTGGKHRRATGLATNDMPKVILDSQAQANCTGTFSVYSSINMTPDNIVLVPANGEEMSTYYSGSVIRDKFELHSVHFSPEIGNKIIVSGSELDMGGYRYEFGRGKCSVTDLSTGRIVGEGRLVDGDYIMDYLKIPRDRTCVSSERPGLMTSVQKAACSVFMSLWSAAASGWSTIITRRLPPHPARAQKLPV